MGHLQHHHHHLLHLPSFGRKEAAAATPKGWVAIRVGKEEEQQQQQQRFMVPVVYLNHPLFLDLLKEAEEEYGFNYDKGAITIPCHVEYFRQVQGLIQKSHGGSGGAAAPAADANHHHAHAHRQFHLTSCFGGLEA